MVRLLASLFLMVMLALPPGSTASDAPSVALASEGSAFDVGKGEVQRARTGEVPLARPKTAPSPAPANTWFLAEGSTAAPFQTWLLFFNPSGSSTANVTLTFMFPNGATSTTALAVGPNRRASLFANLILPNVPAFSTRVDSSGPILVERAMYFNLDGNVSLGATAPQSTWLFAEGSTAPPFHTWFLVQNPGTVPASVTFRFFREGGGSAGAVTVTVGPTSRFSLFANQVIAGTSFSTQVASSQPIVVELSMYETTTGGGHNVMGVATGSDGWNFAEGSTLSPFHTWFLLFNPNNFPVRILARLMPDVGGPGPLLDFTIQALSRTSVFANDIFPNRAFASVWTGQTAEGAPAPIVVNRSMSFFKPNAGSHASVGAPTRDTIWRFAEGATAAPFDEWLLLSNPSQDAAANVTVTFFSTIDGTAVATRTFTVGDRLSIFVNHIVPNVPDLSMVVSSDLPISAERSMYFRQGGTNTIGSPG